MSRLPQEALADRVRRATDAATARASAHTALDDRQLNWAPAEGGWSIAQVFEHLCIVNDGYLARMEPLVTRPDAPRAGSGEGWRPTLMGRLLARAFRNPRPLRAPRRFRPAPMARPGVVQAFLRRQRQLSALLEAARPLAWRRIAVTSPVSRLVRLNLGDCFDILAAHTERHLAQAARLRDHALFPASG